MAIFLDHQRDKDFAVKSIRVSSVDELSKLVELTTRQLSDASGWQLIKFALTSDSISKPQSPQPETVTIRVSFVPRQSNRSVRIRQIRLIGPVDTSEPVPVHHDNIRGIHELALKLFHDLSLQIFKAKADVLTSTSEEASSDLRQHVVGLLFDQKAPLNKVQMHVCEHLLHELHSESRSTRLLVDDTYSFELVSIFASLVNSAAGMDFLSSHLEVLNDVLVLLRNGSDRCQRALIASLYKMTEKLSATQIEKHVRASQFCNTEVAGFANQLAATLALCLELQVRYRGSGKKTDGGPDVRRLVTSIEAAKSLPASDFSNTVALRLLLVHLTAIPSWSAAIEVCFFNLIGFWIDFHILDMRF